MTSEIVDRLLFGLNIFWLFIPGINVWIHAFNAGAAALLLLKAIQEGQE